MSSFNELYNDLGQRISKHGSPSLELKPLLRQLNDELFRRPVDLRSLKESMVGLFLFLTSPDGRTEANCYFIDYFICLAIWT